MNVKQSNQMMQIVELLPIKEIEKFPTVINNIHESTAYQSYHVLQHVETMLMRGDSKETILGFINHFKVYPETITSSSEFTFPGLDSDK